MAKKKVCIVTPKLTAGGTERAVSELANALAQKGDDVTVVLMYHKERYFKTVPEVAVIEPPPLRSGLGKYLYTLYLFAYIRKAVRKEKPDVVLSIGYIAFTLFSLIGLPVRVVFSRRCSPARERFINRHVLNFIYNLSHRIMRGRADGIIAQTEDSAVVYRRKYNCDVAVIPNFVRKVAPPVLPKKDQIITVGRFVFEKAYHYLIEAFSKLDAPGWKLVMVGDGPERKTLEKMVDEYGLREWVEFLGFQHDVDSYLAQSRIFALTSILEGFPNALIEGMATPLPAVSFDCVAGPKDVIRDGVNGFLVAVGDTDAFAERLQYLIDHPGERDRIATEAVKVREEFSIDRLTDIYRDFLVNGVLPENQKQEEGKLIHTRN